MRLRHPFSLVIWGSCWFYLTSSELLWTEPTVMTEDHLLLSGGRPPCCCFVWVQMISAAGDGWAPVSESREYSIHTSQLWQEHEIKSFKSNSGFLVIGRFSWLSSWAERFSFLKLIRIQMILLFPGRTLHPSGQNEEMHQDVCRTGRFFCFLINPSTH